MANAGHEVRGGGASGKGGGEAGGVCVCVCVCEVGCGGSWRDRGLEG